MDKPTLQEIFEERMREEGRKKFEVRRITDDQGWSENALFIDGEYFDWSIDEESFDWAMKQGPEMAIAAQEDIAKHFLDSLSEFVGRKLTMENFIEATQTGWI